MIFSNLYFYFIGVSMKRFTFLVVFLAAGIFSAQSLVQVLPCPGNAYGLTFDGTYLWASGSSGSTFYKIDPQNGDILGTYAAAVTTETRGLAWDGMNMWGYNYIFGSSTANKDKIVNYGPNLTPQDTLLSPYEDYIGGMTHGLGDLWISVYYTGSSSYPTWIVRIDPETGNFLDTLITPGKQPQGLAFDGSNLWLAMDDNDGDPERIWKINPSTGDTLMSFPIPPYNSTVTASPKDMAYDGQYLYLVVGPTNNKGIYKFDVGGQGTPAINLSQNFFTFPNTAVGDTASGIITIYSNGSADLVVDNITFNNPAYFSDPLQLPINIPPGESFEVNINFAPSDFSFYSGTMNVSSNDPLHQNVLVSLNGQGVLSGPSISLTHESLEFGQVWVGYEGIARKSFGIINSGDQTITIGQINNNLTEYVIEDAYFPILIPQNDTTYLTVAFYPTMAGIYSDTLVILSTDPDSPETRLPLNGLGNFGDYSYGHTFWTMQVPDNPNTSADEFRVEGLKWMNDITGDGINEVLIATDNYYVLCVDGASSGTGQILWKFNSYMNNSNAGSIGATWEYGVQDAIQVHPDLNNDGFNDVVIGTGGGNEHVYALDGTNGQIVWEFGDNVNYSLGDFSAIDVQRDFNLDGKNDVLAIADGNETGTGYKKAFLFNSTNGQIIWTYTFPGPNPSFGKAIISIDDISGDGKPDVVIGYGNNGSTNLTTAALNGTNAGVLWTFNSVAYEPKELLEYPVAGEKPDVIVAEYFGRVHRIDGETGAPMWTNFFGSSAGMIQINLIRDVNADGSDDILVAAFSGGVACISGETGLLIWSWPMNYQYGVYSVPDLNNDGLDDVIAGDQNGVVFLISGNGSEVFYSYTFAGDRVSAVNCMPSIDGNASWELLAGSRAGKLICFSGGLNAISSGWMAEISIADNGVKTGTLEFGQLPNASDGIDPQLGELELPPVPPTGVFDIRFILPTTPQLPSLIDYRNIENTEAAWEIKMQPGAGGYPLTISWDPSDLPDGTFLLKDPFGGMFVNVDMKSTDSYLLTNTALNTLIIEFSGASTAIVSVSQGWNILSVPLIAEDMAVSSLFPGALSNAFGFDNGYYQAENLANGEGYWLKFEQAEEISISGTAVSGDINVNAGWNLIGPYDFPAPVSGIITDPPGIIQSQFFGYENGYVQADVLSPGKGYWLKVSQNGGLILSASAKAQSAKDAYSGGASIIIRDASGAEFRLFALSEQKGFNELPPLPPAEVKDVRFADGTFATVISEEGEYINFQGLSYPISILVQNSEFLIQYSAKGNDLRSAVKHGEELVISEASANRIHISGTIIPSEYSLSQNYPNPFNPETIINYQLKVDGEVSLRIYDVLGREVARLVSAKKDAGWHKTTFNAANMTSGVYFYSIEIKGADGSVFSDVKKMLMVK